MPQWFTSKSDPEDTRIQETLKSSCVLPRHIGIIMDGNGRWAKIKGKSRIAGHVAGVESVRDVVEASSQLGIENLTLFTFSIENWKRPKPEISALMKLLIKVLRKEAVKLLENDIRLEVIGDMEMIPDDVRKTLDETIELTRKNRGMAMTIALSYSGKWDITQACRHIALQVKQGLLDPETIDENLFASYLSTASMPDPDLLIRTSGEYRISNFMLWQNAYSEIIFSNTLWPDFRRNELYEAIREFQKRERRFGKTSEQLKTNEVE
ncbi:MAG TPA: isoprenyl transferase [Chlorobaculum sp.]|jgi:undecaprenyl diphosphate synthase|uniref:Isoprenyl transferase n=1 Tax=Chlorobaculum tepidum (strain ATCC 49652 / DSM 12025 / NBRC 103806 / TLS) TaxID=194439 RepID=ISPT_CHLTE|nr:isoprenyl transferase [Chlorobaculum tepidum]Q8KFQ5.1 RecName: Full=Isoprenyl transferase [Chlorobaculum tepidum TLS]AAM71513.1 undecaprenyl diphosphate synthase [Chlorobaculum tepidum TLS]HBU23741.1 isoprenyl transferase [Chlorobaculum sp.]